MNVFGARKLEIGGMNFNSGPFGEHHGGDSHPPFIFEGTPY